MATDKSASDNLMDDVLIDEDSVLGGEDCSAGASSLEDSSDSDALDLSPILAPIIKTSPGKKAEAIKRPASNSPSKGVSLTLQKNGSDSSSTSPPIKKKIIMHPESCPSDTNDGKKQTIKISDASTAAEDKAKLREVKFGAAKSNDLVVVAKKSGASSITPELNPMMDEKLKKRAERFGSGTTSASETLTTQPVSSEKITLSTEDTIKMAKRMERFSAITANTVSTTAKESDGNPLVPSAEDVIDKKTVDSA